MGGAQATPRSFSCARPGQEQEVAPPGEVGACDLVIALGGDGTTLAALRAAAPAEPAGARDRVRQPRRADRRHRRPLDDALDRVARGDYHERHLPGLVAERDGDGDLTALNDLVLVRAGAGQVMFEVQVDGERFIRLAGDGVVAATPLGSTAYTLAAGGPMLAPGATGHRASPRSPRTAASARRSSPAPTAA